MDIRDSYDSVARAYAEELSHELDHKPLDRHLLNRFAEETAGKGLVADLGCGPGHITRYLRDRDVRMVGVDLSPEMIRIAGERQAGIEFRVGDMKALELADASLAGLIAFYAIVHFEPGELGIVFREMRRVLRPGAPALISFHVGDQVVHRDELFGAPVSLDFRFLAPDRVVESLRSAGLAVTERSEREPYEGVEFASRRCYLLARALRDDA